MGLLGNIFGKKHKTRTQHPSHKVDWDFYFTNVDRKLSSIAVDLGLANIAPIKDQKNVCWVSIKMLAPREDGLSSNSESEILGDIEDQLAESMKVKHSATHVGRLTSDGNRDIYFYVSDITLVDKTISDVMLLYPKYSFDYGTKEDEKWSGYFDFLYPLPQQMQSIQNRRVIDNLEKGGDKLTKERPVDHWIYFKTENDKRQFWNRIENEGFKIVTDDHDKSFGENPYRLHISRVDKVDQNSVDEYVIHLWKLAGEYNGDYDGWETSIETD
ncbi:DUF695 domain-containing protein [Chryseosolibacter indicus]|uniref:DUF695 domain-containing protein n=1 Tax=Chryseosolibacter indicus TaxID=2782351 RepID=A0ABS5VN76_9BACT|nr:DUF695 domain-containing protein [Chryseosolibacter indicus]MBT1702290.1 DUF695 domain-containing protein [Chryseosolibacter indicus]